MYRFAKKFNSQTILKYTTGRLINQPTAEYLEVVLKLNLHYLVVSVNEFREKNGNLQQKVLAKMRPTSMRVWVLSGDEDLIYRNDGEEVVISSKTTDLNLSLNDLRCIYEKLHSKFSIILVNTYRPWCGTRSSRGSRRRPNWNAKWPVFY